MEQETLYNILTGQYGEILETHAMWQCIASLGIKPFRDGNQWCYLYGDNIQEGICGFGETIYKAAWDFYTNIKTEEARQAKPEIFDTMAFQKGVKEGKRLMMEGAVEEEVQEVYRDDDGIHCCVSVGTDYEPGTIVYVITIPKEGKDD